MNPAPGGDFPRDFLWGVSSSAYQTEDVALSSHDRGHFLTDWDLFFQAGRLATPKGDGTYSFTNYARDIEALKQLGVTHYRFSIEWARVEPEPGCFNDQAIEHYVAIAKALREQGITPVVALWHFTFPSWLTDLRNTRRHGWLNERLRTHWPLYVRRMVRKLKPFVDCFAPQNEPNTQAMCGFLAGIWPPGERFNARLYYRSMRRAAEAFCTAAELIREIHPESKIISIQNMVAWKKCSWDPLGVFLKFAQEFNTYHLDRIIDEIDWVGFTYYMGETASPVSVFTQSLHKGPETSDLGWPIDPQGLAEIVSQITQRYRKPVVVMENGVAAESDEKRQAFLDSHLSSLAQALRQGGDVRGYFHWSLIDNYEWSYGYGPKFGLFSMDETSRHLEAKPSADLFRQWIHSTR